MQKIKKEEKKRLQMGEFFKICFFLLGMPPRKDSGTKASPDAFNLSFLAH